MNIFVYLEPSNNGLKRSSYEVITAARNLAESSPSSIKGIMINGTSDQANSCGEYGLSEIFNYSDQSLLNYSSTAYASVIRQIAKSNNADCILFSGNATGLELAPRISAMLGAGYIADCVGLDYSENNIIAKKPVYAGKAQISCLIKSPIKVFSLRPNVFTAVKTTPVAVKFTDTQAQIDENDKKVFVSNRIKNEGKLDVLEADIIVSGGRGIKGPENYNLIESLAESLGGAVGASRAVVDAGWRPHSEQVGQTGKTVSPTLYVACGISGAVQHLAGMSTSKIILAINKDKDAPIFKVADYGIVGDIFNVLPQLTEKIKTVSGK